MAGHGDPVYDAGDESIICRGINDHSATTATASSRTTTATGTTRTPGNSWTPCFSRDPVRHWKVTPMRFDFVQLLTSNAGTSMWTPEACGQRVEGGERKGAAARHAI